MKERVRPSPEAIERIRQLGGKRILQFLDEVSLGSVRNLVEFLPTVHGFRPQSEAGIRQQKNVLAKKLSNRTGGVDRDHFALYVMWRAWAWERLGDADAAESLLDDLEKGIAQSRAQEDQSSEQNRAAVVSFTERLKDLSVEGKCSRETIERLIEFSPLTIDDAVQKALASSKSAKEIERDAAFTNLRNRLKEDEQEIQAIKARVSIHASELSSATARLEALAQTTEGQAKSFDALSEAIAALRESIADSGKGLARYDEVLSDHGSRIGALGEAKNSVDQKHNELVRLVDATLSPLEAELRELRATVGPLQHKWAGISPASSDLVDSLINEIAALNGKLLDLSERSDTDEIESLKSRISALETTPTPVAGPEPTPHVADPNALSALLIPVEQTTKVTVWSDAAQFVSGLAASFQSIGLKKSPSATLAEEVCAAALTGQVVSFKGAFANLVARKCATTVSHGIAWSVSIPIGLADGLSLAAALRSRASSATQNVASVVLEGINRSALDATRETLLAIVQDRPAGRFPPMFLFASVLPGIASLPIEPEHLELGPVIDLDYLDWRLTPEAHASSAEGAVTLEVAKAIETRLTQGSSDDLDEAVRVVRLFVPKPKPSIERVAAKSYVALKNLRNAKAEISPMQSLAFGWLVPLWVASGVTKENADSELDGGKCDAQRPDARIAAMLKSETFGPEPTEGNA